MATEVEYSELIKPSMDESSEIVAIDVLLTTGKTVTYLISRSNIHELISTEAALNRKFIPVLETVEQKFSIVKYPFCKPKMVRGRPIFFRKLTSSSMFISGSTYLQSNKIVSFIERDEDVDAFDDLSEMVQATEEKLLELYHEFN